MLGTRDVTRHPKIKNQTAAVAATHDIGLSAHTTTRPAITVFNSTIYFGRDSVLLNRNL